MCNLILNFLFWVFVGATLVQLAAWWGLFAKLAFRKSVIGTVRATLPPVSVIICARNEAENLRNNLALVLEQEYPEFEVLVLDDDSNDATSTVLQPFLERYSQLRVLRFAPKTTPGKKQILATGIAAARYEHLVFTDADCWPASKFWLQQLAGGFVKVGDASPPEIILGYGPYRRESGFFNKWLRFETVQTVMQYFSLALAGQPYMGVGRNLAWHRSLFQRVGGFQAHAALPSGDDDLLVNAAAHAGNTVICLDPKAYVYSTGEKSWRAWWRQKKRHLGAGQKYRPQHQFLLGLLALTHSLHYFLFAALVLTDFGIISVALYAIRMASAFPIHRKILRQLREEHLLLWFPLLDSLLATYYAVFVPRVLICSDDLISWK